MYPLGIIVFGCLTKDKYRQQLEDIYTTWGKDARELGCLLRFYVGDIPEDLDAGMKACCINVQQGDDYISATFKQWRGLELMADGEELCRFYYVCGSDTFLHVKNALVALSAFDYSKPLYIGGSMGIEPVEGKPTEYFSGGAGFFLTHSACNLLLDKCSEFIWWWLDVGTPLVDYVDEQGVKRQKSILAASDLQLAVLANQVGLEWVRLDPLCMRGVSSWNDEGVDKDTLISCHPMPHEQVLAYYAYLQGAKDDDGVFLPS